MNSALRLAVADAAFQKVARQVSFPEKAAGLDLVQVALQALDFWPPLYPQSVFGPARTWLPPFRYGSELAMINPLELGRTLQYLQAVLLPSIARRPPPLAAALLPPFVRHALWRPTTFFVQPDPFGSPVPRHGEAWFFLNGMITDAVMARRNAALLAWLFRRPLTVIHNDTNSFLLDLVEAAVGKHFSSEPGCAERGTLTEPALKATVAILDALNRPEVERVVVIAHSQGTIIAANVLRAVVKALHHVAPAGSGHAMGAAHAAADELTLRAPARRGYVSMVPELARALHALGHERLDEKVRKLEIYAFANCADRMRYVIPPRRGEPGYPRIESFANERDLVARLGVLAPCQWSPRCDTIQIDGPIYEKKGVGPLKSGAWGHLLNAHYLFAIADYHEALEAGREPPNPYPPARRGDPEMPRLYAYLGGRRPAD